MPAYEISITSRSGAESSISCYWLSRKYAVIGRGPHGLARCARRGEAREKKLRHPESRPECGGCSSSDLGPGIVSDDRRNYGQERADEFCEGLALARHRSHVAIGWAGRALDPAGLRCCARRRNRGRCKRPVGASRKPVFPCSMPGVADLRRSHCNSSYRLLREHATYAPNLSRPATGVPVRPIPPQSSPQVRVLRLRRRGSGTGRRCRQSRMVVNTPVEKRCGPASAPCRTTPPHHSHSQAHRSSAPNFCRYTAGETRGNRMDPARHRGRPAAAGLQHARDYPTGRCRAAGFSQIGPAAVLNRRRHHGVAASREKVIPVPRCATVPRPRCAVGAVVLKRDDASAPAAARPALSVAFHNVAIGVSVRMASKDRFPRLAEYSRSGLRRTRGGSSGRIRRRVPPPRIGRERDPGSLRAPRQCAAAGTDSQTADPG